MSRQKITDGVEVTPKGPDFEFKSRDGLIHDPAINDYQSYLAEEACRLENQCIRVYAWCQRGVRFLRTPVVRWIAILTVVLAITGTLGYLALMPASSSTPVSIDD